MGEIVMLDGPNPRNLPRNMRYFRWSVLAVALLLRIAAFPHHDEVRDIDETGYLQGSLQLLEGLPAGSKAAPAGPNFWVGWLYTGGVAAWHMFHPGAEERAVPFQIRPFVAVNHAVFDQYQHLTHLHVLWVISQIVLTLVAAVAASRLGMQRAGMTGAIWLGGLVAVLPLYVEFSEMSRPYMTAWGFGFLAFSSAAAGKPGRRVVWSGIFLGLAVASRVEMILIAPMILWEFWNRPEPRRLHQVWLKVLGVTAIATLLASPWLLTSLLGTLRTIATVRLGPNPQGPTTLAGLLKQLAWQQGLAGVMLCMPVILIGLLIPAARFETRQDSSSLWYRCRLVPLVIYIIALVLSLGHGTVFLHQQGPIVLALIVFSTFAMSIAGQFSAQLAPWIAGAFLLIPLGQTIRLIVTMHSRYAADPSTQWIEAHVPAGTRVYTQLSFDSLLPTAEASRDAWSEVTDDSAWRRKFASGLKRFSLSLEQIPPVLSDENLVQERGIRRGLFIMGGRPELDEPRYDIRLYGSSPVFGIQDVVAAFRSTGGIVVARGGRGLAGLGTPEIHWDSRSGETGTFVYCSPDVKARLKE